MATDLKHSQTRRSTAALIRSRIKRSGERIWRLEDFADLPTAAAAQTLSRLAREGMIERLSKGVYYHARGTAFGKSRPNPAAIRKLAARKKSVYPAGLAAANLLGFSTQSGKSGEVATSATSLPRKLLGSNTTIHTRRPHAWKKLSQDEAALLDILRRRAEHSELTDEQTVKRLLKLIADDGCFQQLLRVANTEPPRVRAMLGAIGEQLGIDDDELQSLRDSLNPLTRFDFGKLSALKYAEHWQARDHR